MTEIQQSITNLKEFESKLKKDNNGNFICESNEQYLEHLRLMKEIQNNIDKLRKPILNLTRSKPKKRKKKKKRRRR